MPVSYDIGVNMTHVCCGRSRRAGGVRCPECSHRMRALRLHQKDQGMTMESTAREWNTRQSGRDEPRTLPAIVSCVAGLVGMAVVAAAPWWLLTSDAAWETGEPPAFQSQTFAAGAALRLASGSRE